MWILRMILLGLKNMLHQCFALLTFFSGRNRGKKGEPGKIWARGIAHFSPCITDFVSPSDMITLKTLVALYDDDTYAHSQRSAYLAEAVARYLNFSDEEISQTYLAALLHDIGKTGIPHAILAKRSPLSDEEWAIMRLHALVGQDMLSRAGSIFCHLAPIVVAHHERWDGQGYPLGLARDEIPMIARILAVVDSYDAMLSARTYQKSSSHARAYEELQKCAGSQYDPRAVAAFLGMLDAWNEPATVLSFSPLALFKTRTSPL